MRNVQAVQGAVLKSQNEDVLTEKFFYCWMIVLAKTLTETVLRIVVFHPNTVCYL